MTFKQCRNWCFTDFKAIKWKNIYDKYSDIIRYMCWGEETCPETKKTHNQGWIQFNNKKTMGGVKKIVDSKEIHLECCRGDEYDNDKYCKKEGKWEEHGTFIKQGQRTDLEQIKKSLDEGKDMRYVANENFQLFIQYNNSLNKYKQLVDEDNSKKFRQIEVIVHKGATETGKTRLAMGGTENIYKIQGTDLEWWDGYCGQKTLVIDEYDNDVKITKLLGILDGYQLRLPVKGGFTYARWTKIYITTNLKKLHKNAKQMHRRALRRRITRVIKFATVPKG